MIIELELYCWTIRLWGRLFVLTEDVWSMCIFRTEKVYDNSAIIETEYVHRTEYSGSACNTERKNAEVIRARQGRRYMYFALPYRWGIQDNTG